MLEQNLKQLEATRTTTPENRSFAAIFKAYGPKFWKDPSYDTSYLLEGVENNSALDRLRATLPTRADAERALGRLKMPALVVHGKYDYGIPYMIWEDLVSDLDNVTFELLPESSHSPQTEHPDDFDPILISWIAGL